jgi:hypothetical protein
MSTEEVAAIAIASTIATRIAEAKLKWLAPKVVAAARRFRDACRAFKERWRNG